MMLVSMSIGSFLITWFVPESVVERLKKDLVEDILEKYCVIKLEVAGERVYQTTEHITEPTCTASGDHSSEATATVASPHPSSRDRADSLVAIATEQEYDFIEQLSQDFFCPITKCLLLQPHLTACCGHHVSDEAATRIQEDGGACPMCKEPNLKTMLDKRCRRQVHELHVFCRHKESGCVWEGELSTFEQHVQSCSWKNSPLEIKKETFSLKAPGETTKAVDPSKHKQVVLQCHTQRTAPCGMIRGSAATDQNFAYFASLLSKSTYRYTLSGDNWEELPPCPYSDSGLVVVDSALTAVGGREGSQYTNQLVTLRQSQWVEEHPPMHTARSSPAVVSTSDGVHMNIIVIGGEGDGSNWTNAIELFNTGSRKWSQLTNLPQPLTLPSATICDNQLYIIGRNGDGYSCSMQVLLSSDRSVKLQSLSRTLILTPLPRLPVNVSTVATLYEQIVIIGGKQDESPVKSIHQLIEGQWVKTGSMSSGRIRCLVVCPSPHKMVVVGGLGATYTALDSVEVCNAV